MLVEQLINVFLWVVSEYYYYNNNNIIINNNNNIWNNLQLEDEVKVSIVAIDVNTWLLAGYK